MSAFPGNVSRRSFLGTAAFSLTALNSNALPTASASTKAQIAITLDLEMSRHYPQRGQMEWDFQKGNLNAETRDYALQAAKRVRDRGAVIHFFCVGRVLEQPDIRWLQEIAEMGHPIGNHTYDHVNVWAQSPEQTQFRFQRSPWLIEGKSTQQILRENIRLTTLAMKQRLGIAPVGFRTPGGSSLALNSREDLQTMLLDEGFSWVSSGYPPHQYGQPKMPPTEDVYQSIVDAMAKSQPYVYPTGLIEIPMSPISDVGAFRSSWWKREYFIESIRRCIHWAIEHNGVFDFLCHPSIMYVEDPGFEVVDAICDIVESADDRAQIVSLDEIAKSMA